MSGRKINDHSFWAGSSGKGSVLPLGSKMKQESSADGRGGLASYPDTTEAVKGVQQMQNGKISGHPMKSGHRN
jgi:hypothetical protein